MRVRLLGSLVAAVVVLGVSMAACGANNGLSGDSAAEVLDAGLAAAHHAGSLSFVDKLRGAGVERILVGEAAADAGQQSLRGEGSALDVRLVDGVAFVRGGTDVLHGVLGLPAAVATAEVGKWLSLTSGDMGYAAVVKSLEPDAELDAYIPHGTLHLLASRTLHGVTVVGVAGSPSASSAAGELRAQVVLYVSIAAPYLPVGGTLSGTDVHGRSLIDAAVFSGWGRPVRPAAPTGAVAVSSLPH